MSDSFSPIWVNGVPQATVSVADRGLQYGDGLFETLRLQQHRLPLLPWHLQRLAAGAARLAIPLDTDQLVAELKLFIASLADVSGVIKIILTRGNGERGYLPPEHPSPTRIFIASPARDWSGLAEQGLTLRLCRQRIMELPEIAGLKILGRLDLVLARSEWRDTSIHDAIHEGLMFDSRDNIIEGTMSNLFLVSHGRLLTPLLDNAGVAGVARRIILETLATQIDMPVEERHIREDDLYRADELFVCNAVAGILPVRSVQSHRYTSIAVAHTLRQQFETLVLQQLAAS